MRERAEDIDGTRSVAFSPSLLMGFSSLRKAPSVHEKIMADRELMVAGPFMVMNSDARHPKEFSTENTLGGNFVLPAVDDSFA